MALVQSKNKIKTKGEKENQKASSYVRSHEVIRADYNGCNSAAHQAVCGKLLKFSFYVQSTLHAILHKGGKKKIIKIKKCKKIKWQEPLADTFL